MVKYKNHTNIESNIEIKLSLSKKKKVIEVEKTCAIFERRIKVFYILYIY